MSDKKITIGIETTANTAGAQKATAALDDTADKAKELDAALDQVGGPGGAPGSGLPGIPAQAKAATASIKDVQSETNKLGKGGNSGRALLEFSRAFEDAQFGINGILNNLPGLIAALGGTAGLAGVISIVAVAGSVLWGNFGKGTKKAKVDTEDLTERIAGMLKVYQEFAALGKDAREKAAEDVAANLKRSLSGIDNEFKVSLGSEDVATAQAQAEAAVKLAQDKLDLTRVEAALVTATGEEAVRLAARREIIIKRIYRDEQAIAEIGRTAALNKAQAKVETAGEKVGVTATAANQLDAQYRELKFSVESLREEADKLTASRIFAQGVLEKERILLSRQIVGMKEELESTTSLDRANTLDSKIGQAESRIEAIGKLISAPGTTEREIGLLQQANIQEVSLKEMEKELKASADAQKAAADAQTAATLELKNLRQIQNIQRAGEVQLKGIADAGVSDQKIAAGKTAVVGQLEGLVSGIGESGGKDLAPFITEMKAILQDKALSAAEFERVPILLSQYFNQILNLGNAQNSAIRDATNKVDALVRDVRNLKITANQRNP